MDAVTAFLTALSPVARAALLGGLGSVLGSFIATLVIRWPAGRSVSEGRSACDHCAAVLTPLDLVPIASALASRGKCRHCGAPIDPLHWRVELAATLVGASAGALLPGIGGPLVALFGWLLLTLAALDLTEYWLPDTLTLTLALAGLATGAAGIAPPFDERLIGGAAGFAALWTVGTGYRLLRGREGLGGGDPKLLGAIGLWVGWRLLPQVVLIASLIGLAVVLLASATGRAMRADDRLPFGTLLAIAAYPVELAMLMAGA